MGRLTTHVLDTASGCPAAGMALTLYKVEAGERHTLFTGKTNADGRCDTPLLDGEAMQSGCYELVFAVADYFRACGVTLPEWPFLDLVTLAFGVSDAAGHYHVPLLVSPWAYSTYRGS